MKRKLKSSYKDQAFVWSIVGPAILFFAVIVYYPFLKNIYYMFFNYNFIKKPKFVGLDNITKFFADTNAHTALKNTFTITIFSVPLVLIVALLIAIAVFNMKKGKSFVRASIFSTFLVPGVVAAIIFKLLFGTENGLINTTLNSLGFDSIGWLIQPFWAIVAVIIVHVWNGTGYYMVIFLSGLSNINTQLYEAAKIDGASILQSFRYVTLPQLKPTIVFSMIYATMAYLRTYPSVELLTGGGPYQSTETIIMYMFKQGFKTRDVGYASVIAVIVFLITLVVSIVQMKATKYFDD
ncbi:carbohydrate ABC transporter permease [Clostridium sp. MB05]